MAEKHVEDSIAEQVHFLRYEDINGQGNLFGGRLVAWMDEVGGTVATRHIGTKVATASIDNLVFKKSAVLDDLVVVEGHATYVGNTSMEVRVDAYLEDRKGMRRPINRAYLTMVSLDDNGKPQQIKNSLIIETESQKAEWENAKKRIELRKYRHKEGF